MEQAAPVLSGWANFLRNRRILGGRIDRPAIRGHVAARGATHRGTRREIRAFGTPTVVLFCAALLISAGMNIPWHSLFGFRCFIGVCGVAAVCYASTRIWHALKAAYKPDAEDWFWYIALPLLAYAALVPAAILYGPDPVTSLDLIAAITLVLLFAGIHNAWDTVTYIALSHRPTEPGP